MIAGDGLCDERAVRVLCDEGPRYTRELDRVGRQLQSRRRRRAGARVGRRAQRPACPSRARRHGARNRPRAVGARLVGRAHPRAQEHARGQRDRRRRPMPRRAVHRRARRAGPGVRARDAARDRRRRSGLRRDDQSRSGDRRWRGARLSRRRAHRRHGVRAVSSDRARRRGCAADSCSRRRFAARVRGSWTRPASRSCRTIIRRPTSRRAMSSRAASCSKSRANRGPDLS